MAIGVILVNLGTPDSPKTGDVRKYLREFLMDARVIDIPFLSRWMLVNLIIAPFRAPKSAKVYQELWTEQGSPLLVHGINVQKKLQESLGENYIVELAMRYQNPSIAEALNKIKKYKPERLIVIPLFPQYASATTGSVFEKVMDEIKKWWIIPDISFVGQYFEEEGYIDAVIDSAKDINFEHFDHVLFSYHGVPVRHVDKVYNDSKPCSDHHCETLYDDTNRYCYKAACYETSRRIAEKMTFPKAKMTTCFQSRLGKDPWIEPYTEETVINLAKSGVKKIAVFCPAFTADCLETTIEIGEEYAELFKKHGGDELKLIPSLNSNQAWIDFLADLVRKR